MPGAAAEVGASVLAPAAASVRAGIPRAVISTCCM